MLLLIPSLLHSSFPAPSFCCLLSDVQTHPVLHSEPEMCTNLCPVSRNHTFHSKYVSAQGRELKCLLLKPSFALWLEKVALFLAKLQCLEAYQRWTIALLYLCNNPSSTLCHALLVITLFFFFLRKRWSRFLLFTHECAVENSGKKTRSIHCFQAFVVGGT